MRGDCKRDTTLACGEETRHMLRNAPPPRLFLPYFLEGGWAEMRHPWR